MKKEELDNISFNMPKSRSNSIKIIGVGGGGSNAVNYMFQQNIEGVDFVICNTDLQALESSDVPNKVQLGVNLTGGLGAGSNPEVGKKSAEENLEEIKQMLSVQTKMVFITAGMGGGTGTGAAPIIAKIAKEMGILTVGIITMPFSFEGKMRVKQSEKGIEMLRDNVDSLIVINNNKLREVYGNLGYKSGFSKADEVVSTAARGIAEVITHHYKQNIDLHDVKTVLENSGTAIMGSAKESGSDRAKNAIVKALDSPLLNDNKITGAKNVLLLIVSGTDEITMDEIGEINEHIQDEAGHETNIIMGAGDDESLEDAITVTIVATGFPSDQQNTIINAEGEKIIYKLEDEKKVEADEVSLTPTSTFIKNIDVIYDEIKEESTVDKNFIIADISPETEEITKKQKLADSQTSLVFDLHIEGVNDIKVNDAIEIIEEKERKTPQKIHILDDFEAKPTIAKSSKLNTNSTVEAYEKPQFEIKTKPKDMNEIEIVYDEITPSSLTKKEPEKPSKLRSKKLKERNYKFKNIEEMENTPAYKRLGIDQDEINLDISKSRTTLNTDSSDDSQLRSNNSFLHDNVD